jgi:hypothetical protein
MDSHFISYNIFEFKGKFGIKKNNSEVLEAIYNEIIPLEEDGFILKLNSYFGYFSKQTDKTTTPKFSHWKKISLYDVYSEIDSVHFVYYRSESYRDFFKLFNFIHFIDGDHYGLCSCVTGDFFGLYGNHEAPNFFCLSPLVKTPIKFIYHINQSNLIRILDTKNNDVVDPYFYEWDESLDSGSHFLLLRNEGLLDCFNRDFNKLDIPPFTKFIYDEQFNGILINQNENWILFDKNLNEKKRFDKLGVSGKYKPRFGLFNAIIAENKLFGIYDDNCNLIFDHQFLNIEYTEWWNYILTDSANKKYIYCSWDCKMTFGPIDELLPIKNVDIKGQTKFDGGLYLIYDSIRDMFSILNMDMTKPILLYSFQLSDLKLKGWLDRKMFLEIKNEAKFHILESKLKNSKNVFQSVTKRYEY